MLYSPRRMNLGGQSSIRGFKEQTLSGDSGGYWRNQLRWIAPVPWSWLQPAFDNVSVALAWDIGAIERDRYNKDSGAYGRLSGHALEFSAGGRYVQASLTLARSEKRPSVLEKSEAPVYFRLGFTY